MFFPECESLAADYSELRGLIEQIDSYLKIMGPNPVLRVEDFASFFKARQSQVRAVFDQLDKLTLLRKESWAECECGNLMDAESYQEAIEAGDSFECSSCEKDLVKQSPNIVTVYRLNVFKTVRKDKVSVNMSKSILPEPIVEFDEPLPEVFLKDPFRNMLLLRYYSREEPLKSEMPFAGKRVVFVLHFLRDLIPFIEATIALGLEPANTTLFYKDYPYPQRKAIGNWLEARGFKIFPRSYIKAFLKNLCESGTDRIGKLLIVEDGGFFVPMIHREFPDLISFTLGAVEQTTRGLRNAQAWEKESGDKLKIPLLSIADSKLKSQFEPDYIAKAVVQNLQRLLPNEVLNGKGVALFGCGTIGRALVNWLIMNHAIVTVYETKDENRLWAWQNGALLADSPEEAVRNKNFVIGASGNQSVDSAVISNLMHGVFLISASSEQYEIDINELSQQAGEKGDLINNSGKLIGTYFILHPDRKINLLANGYPINFWGMDSMPEKASDLIMSIILLAAAEVANGKYSAGINSDAVNELADKYKVAGKFNEIHRQG